MQAGASNGTIEDLGAFHALWFTDPDGMRGELTLIVDPALRGIHAPRPLTTLEPRRFQDAGVLRTPAT